MGRGEQVPPLPLPFNKLHPWSCVPSHGKCTNEDRLSKKGYNCFGVVRFSNNKSKINLYFLWRVKTRFFCKRITKNIFLR